jgi:tetratricopeptide (TPR) repeat protein
MIGAVALVIGVGAQAAAPGRPSAQLDGNHRDHRRSYQDHDVVARVPGRAIDPATAQRALLTWQLAENPRDVEKAVRLARLDVAAARQQADPRFLGRAERTLAAWWDLDRLPADVRLLRATIRQSRHEFEPALADLDRLTEERPDDPQAWLTRAVVLGVRGRYPEALQSCQRLEGLVAPLDVLACRAPLLGLTGHLDEARGSLLAEMPRARSPLERAWTLSVLGELSVWAGDPAAAEALLRAALAAEPQDSYSRAALADLLLDRHRADEVAALLNGRTQDDGLLLRQALAEVALERRASSSVAPGNTRLAGDRSDGDRPTDAIAELASRMEANRRRGDSVHLREEARAALAIDGDGPRALALAIRNWEVQHEPADARVLLEAAVATGDRQAAVPVLAWLARTGFEWPVLRRLALTLGGGGS